MYAAALRAELRLADVHSLKAKRHRLKIIMADLRRAFPAIALSEVDHQDLWQRAAIGVAVVAPQAGQLDRVLHAVERKLRDRPDAELLSVTLAHLEEAL